MASKRMFSLPIVNSAKFLKMPISTQALYFHLCMRADDDGVVEGFTVLRMVGATEDDLKVLVSKGYVIVLNEDLVAFIVDWKEHNKIRADRKIDSIYKSLLMKVVPDENLIEPRPRGDSKEFKKENGQTMDGQMSDNGQTMDGIGKVRLGKDSIDKISIDKDSINAKQKYGSYNHVLLTEDEYTQLRNDLGDSLVAEVIRYLDEYIEMKGTKYKNCYLVIKKWVIDAVKKKQSGTSNIKQTGFNNFKPRDYDYDSLEKKLLGWDE